jgi:hypothetical protein
VAARPRTICPAHGRLAGSFNREVQVSCFQLADHSPDDTIRDSLVKDFAR